MHDPISIEIIQQSLIEIRGQQVLLDSDVARIYGVETRDINKAVRNNPDKFPANYLIHLTKLEKQELVENFDCKRLKGSDHPKPVLVALFKGWIDHDHRGQFR